MSENENAMDGKDENVNSPTENERVRFENERMTRRKALRKFGFTAGMAVFSVLTVDDLARVASKKLQETEATKGIGDMLAKEFRSAGVALANDPGGDPYGNNPYNPYERSCELVCWDSLVACYDNVSNTTPFSSPAYATGRAQCDANYSSCIVDYCGGENPYGNPYEPPPCESDACRGCLPDVITGEVNCQQCSVGIAAEGSVANIASIMAEVGVPGDVTIPDGAIANCQAEAEDACTAASNPTPDAVAQTYAECLGNTILTDVSVGMFYDDLVNALLRGLR